MTMTRNYITELKELSDENQKDLSVEKVADIDTLNKGKTTQPKIVSEQNIAEKKVQEREFAEITSNSDSLLRDNIVIDPRPFSVKDILLGVINLISVIFIVVILIGLPKTANEIKKIRIETESNSKIISAPTSQELEYFNKLEGAFLDDKGIVGYVNDVEKLKLVGTSIQKVSFASQIPVKDKTGNMGYAVVVEFRGSWEQISTDLSQVQKLPYLVRPVRFKMEKDLNNEETKVIVLDYGVILYVKNETAQN